LRFAPKRAALGTAIAFNSQQKILAPLATRLAANAPAASPPNHPPPRQPENGGDENNATHRDGIIIGTHFRL
jgi:hypothetical protein